MTASTASVALVAPRWPARKQPATGARAEPEHDAQARRPRPRASPPRAAAGHRRRDGLGARRTRASRARLSQAPIEVASARPDLRVAAPSAGSCSTTLTATAVSDALTGVSGVAAREKCRGHAADQHERKQAERIGGERRPAARRIRRGERAAHEQRAHDEVGHQQERDDARDREQQRELDRAVLRAARAAPRRRPRSGSPFPAAARCRRRCRSRRSAAD